MRTSEKGDSKAEGKIFRNRSRSYGEERFSLITKLFHFVAVRNRKWFLEVPKIETVSGILVIRICLITFFAGTPGIEAMTQDRAHHVIDFVDLPTDLVGKDPDRDSAWYIEFRETWNIHPDRSIISKSVVKYFPRDRNAPLVSADTLQQRLATLIRQQPESKGTVQLRNLSYEFMLLDPHIRESGNKAFPEPDSMDSWTRRLQMELIQLIQSRCHTGALYDYHDQLLSVHFHEDWIIDPGSMEIFKKVQGITPVMWQRRETTTGEPLNDADTGLPVYYKNKLDRIDLRNP